MSNGQHIDIFLTGCKAWNAWRQSHPTINPDLSGEDLGYIIGIDDAESDKQYWQVESGGYEKWPPDLSGFNFFRTDLSGCYIAGLSFEKAFLREANISHATLLSSSLVSVNLKGANLSFADLRGVCFYEADLTDTVLKESIIGLTFVSSLIAIVAKWNI